MNTLEDKVTTVFDSGRDTFYTFVLKIQKGTFKLKSTNGITILRSNDFNNMLLPYLAKELKRKQGINLVKGVCKGQGQAL